MGRFLHTYFNKLGIEARKKARVRQPSILTVLTNVTPNVEDNVRLFRYDLTQLLLSLRVPLSVVNNEITRDFVNQHVGPASKFLTDRSNLARDYIPAILAKYNRDTYILFKQKSISLQVDSTNRIGEWYGFIFRCVTDDLQIITRPKLKRISRHLIEKDGAMELSSLVIHVVRDFLDYYRLQFDGNAGQHENVCELVKCISGDRVSINRCAFMKPQVYHAFPKMVFVDCHPHTLANCGKVMNVECTAAEKFWALHIAVFARSEDAKSLWVQHAHVNLKTHNNTRWFAKRDSMEFVRTRWTDYVAFYRLPDHQHVKADSSIAKVRSILCPEYWDVNDVGAYEQAKDLLLNIRLELAIICEASAWYYSACYNLEGISYAQYLKLFYFKFM